MTTSRPSESIAERAALTVPNMETSIHRMVKVNRDSRIMLTLAWLITSVMLSGSLIELLSGPHSVFVSEQERAFEFDSESDKERTDFAGIDFAILPASEVADASSVWHVRHAFFPSIVRPYEYSARYDRGPPV